MADPQQLINDAQAAFGTGDFAKAADCFDQLIKCGALADPSMGYVNKGVALRQLKKYDEAIECFQEVLKLHPGNEQAASNIAQVYCDKKEYKKAVEFLDKLLEKDPKNMAHHRLKCNYLNMAKDYDGTLEAADNALEIEPDNLKIHTEQLLAQVNMAQDPQAALGSDIKISCDWFETKGYVTYDKKKKKLEKTNLDAGEKDFILKILGTALQQVGTFLNTTSDKKKAIEYYNQSIAINPTAVAYFNRGVSYNQLKKRKKALKSFESAVKKDPSMTVCHSMIGMIYLMQKNYFKSMHAYEKLPQQTKASLYNYGVACFKVARRVDAKEKFEAALKIDPDFQHAKDALAMLEKVWSESDKSVENAAPEGDEPPPPPPVDEIKHSVISYADLKAKKNLPKDYDFCNKQKYLSDAEFNKLFGMDKDAFHKLQKWKQNKLKKKVGLF
jgi:tetratricopeptide (TPR) repeat protein